ncbi:MAG: DAK2 domain-containing protein [Clostridia bacterium]|nr:DAK2 domain-containing protein [Clostridia bacterium]
MNYYDFKLVDGFMFEKFAVSGAAKLKQNLKEINDLNVFPIPDGDTGDNMFRTISGGISEMEKEPANSVCKKARALASGMLLSARGNSGVILSQIFYGISTGLEGVEAASVNDLANAFISGAKRAYETVVTPVEGTILTVARESVDDIIPLIDEETTLGEFTDIIVNRMNVSLANTPELLDVLKEAGVIDSGGAGLYLIAEGAYEAIKGNDLTLGEPAGNAPASVDVSLFGKDDRFEFGYCTEFMLRLMSAKCDVDAFDEKIIIDYLSTIGDSIVAFKEGSAVKVHVHTMTPSKALEFCQQFGEFLTVKIENMMLQHNERERRIAAGLPQTKKKRAKFATCVVTTGSGIIDIFKELGVDSVIDGGQGRNPSIKDFIDAFEKINADNIFVFPNNSNILMAAQQAARIYEKSAVRVIPSVNLGQAYAALSMLDYSSGDAEAIEQSFIANMEYALTGMVCRAIRSVDYNDVSVKNNDYIGFTNKKILASSPDKTEALTALCDRLGVADKDIVTVIYGADASEADMERVREAFASRYSGKEFYEIDGMQEVYDFIVIIE